MGSSRLIERREFKFLISHETMAGIRDAVRPFCVLDHNAASAPDHRYLIESLYLDTPTYELFHANEHERKDRFKLRVRHYPNAARDAVFVEVKSRSHDVISKARGRVDAARWPRLIDDPWTPTALIGDDPAVERFFTLVHTLHARPTTLVRYAREAWVSVVDDYARVTFDTRVAAQPARAATFDHDAHGWRGLDDAEIAGFDRSLAILELKFTNEAPSWMMHFVQRFDLWRRAFSKYGAAVRAFWHVPSLRGASFARRGAQGRVTATGGAR